METRTEENPWKNFQPLRSYCCFSVSLLPSMSQLCKGTGVEGKTSSLPRSRGTTSPVQWPSTPSPDWSQLTLIPEITPDDTTGGFSMQLMVEHPFTPEVGSVDMAGHCTARVCTLGTVRREWVILSNCSLQVSTLSDQNIKKNLRDFPITFVDWRITCQLPLSPLISVLDKSILLDKDCYAS